MFWDKVAWIYDVFANVINRKANKALCTAVAELIRPEDEVLECACGTGLLTGVIAPRCRTLTATDFSKEMLKRAERKYGKYPNIKFEQADITRLGYPDASFDAVVAATLNISRGNTEKLISSGYVKLNHREVLDRSKQVGEGDLLSIRNYGRFILKDIGNNTRKGRLHITVEKFV